MDPRELAHIEALKDIPVPTPEERIETLTQTLSETTSPLIRAVAVAELNKLTSEGDDNG